MKTKLNTESKKEFIDIVKNDLSYIFNREVTAEQVKSVISLITCDLKVLSQEALFDTQIDEFLEDVYEQTYKMVK